MNTLRKAEQLLVETRRQLLEFGDELGRGKWSGKEAGAAMRATEISDGIGQAIALLFASDGDQEQTPPSLNLH